MSYVSGLSGINMWGFKLNIIFGGGRFF